MNTFRSLLVVAVVVVGQPVWAQEPAPSGPDLGAQMQALVQANAQAAERIAKLESALRSSLPTKTPKEVAKDQRKTIESMCEAVGLDFDSLTINTANKQYQINCK